MKYSIAPLPRWKDLDGGEPIRVARHYRIPVADDELLLLPHGRPGWLRLPAALYPMLDALDGTSVADFTAWPGFPDAAGTVRALYDAGLVFVGGRTGVRAVPAPRGDGDGDGSRGGGSGGAEPPTALLLKLTGACDIACDYCYDFDSGRWPGRMTSEVARRLITECLVPGRRLTLMFHGGEPMLRFGQIRELVEFAELRATEVGASVHFTVQTNGRHFTEDVVAFLRRYAFTVGVSLDGPQDINDRHRVDHRGRGTFARIAENFDRFPEFMRDEVGYISVVGTDTTPDELDRVWEFFRSMGVHSWKMLPADAEGRADDKPETQRFRQTFAAFLDRRLTEILDGDLEPPYLTNLVQLIEPFLTVERPNMCMKMPCGASNDLLVLDAVGSVRACDCSYHPAFQLLPRAAVSPPPGRTVLPIADGSLTVRSRNTPAAAALRDREQWLLNDAPCSSCPWLHQCAGTCPARALINNGSLYSVDELECTTRLALFPRILEDVSRPGSALRAYYERAKSQAAAGAPDLATAPPR
ncbi:radical SAM protein [Streptomyces sp. NBC_00250]|uniref:radical SAM protein n=1 Tax=Streptomyces sp. NBC_00250 TaxID=2903641 RepID=UPI002E2AB08C|nr:radical SAM protein [Streptomyces sp. NBC_00250]